MELNEMIDFNNDNLNGDKRVLVKFEGGKKPPQEAFIGPGTNVDDFLRHFGLNNRDYVLSKGMPDTVFGANEVLYRVVNNGEALFVTSNVDAGL